MKANVRHVLACAIAFGLLTGHAGAADRKPPARPPDGTYFYAITLDGTQIATYTTVVASTARPATIKSTQIFERTLLGKTSATSTLSFDMGSLHETAYSGEIEMPSGTEPERYNVGILEDVANLIYEGAKIPIRVQPNAPFFVIDDDLGPSDVFVPAMVNASKAKALSLAFVRSGDGALLRVLPADQNPRPASVPATDASVSLSYETDHTIREVYWYDPQTFVLHDLVVPGSKVDVRLTAFVPAP